MPKAGASGIRAGPGPGGVFIDPLLALLLGSYPPADFERGKYKPIYIIHSNTPNVNPC